MKAIIGDASKTYAVPCTQTEINFAQSMLEALVRDGRYIMPSDPYVVSIYRTLLERFEQMQASV